MTKLGVQLDETRKESSYTNQQAGRSIRLDIFCGFENKKINTVSLERIHLEITITSIRVCDPVFHVIFY